MLKRVLQPHRKLCCVTHPYRRRHHCCFKHTSSSSSSSRSSSIGSGGGGGGRGNTSCRKDYESKRKPDLSGVKHQVEHRTKETIGIRLTERVVERVAEAAEHRVERAVASKALTKIAERAAVKRILSTIPARTTIARLGRGGLIALPLVGAGFAAWIGVSDYRRTQHELVLARKRLALAEEEHLRAKAKPIPAPATPPTAATAAMNPPQLDASTARWFGVATAADSVNVFAHVLSAYGLYQGWAPEGIFNAEIASLASAVVSTGGAVRGEYLTARRDAAELNDDEGDRDSDGGGGGERSSVGRDDVGTEERGQRTDQERGAKG